MAEIDTSMYYENRPQPINPMKMMGDYQGIANAVQQNKLLQLQEKTAEKQLQSGQMDLDAKIAMSKAFQNNRNPDGTINMVGVQNELLGSGAVNALDVMAKGIDLNEPVQIGYNQKEGRPEYGAAQVRSTMLNPTPPQPQVPQEQLDNLYDNLGEIKSSVKGLLDLPDEQLNLGKLMGSASDLVTAHKTSGGKRGADAQAVAAALASEDFPRAGSTPQQIREYLQNHLQQLEASEQRLAGYGQRSPLQQQQVEGEQQGAAPTLMLDKPEGFTTPLPESRETYNEIKERAESAPQTLAAVNSVINLVDQGAETGTNIAQVYQYLAKNVPGVAQNFTDKASQTQEIGKYLENVLVSQGMPTSDARLAQLQRATINPDQLPETIKSLAPFFKAVEEGAKAKQKFYNMVTQNGSDLTQEPAAAELWNQNYDPRWIEFDSLPNTKEGRGEFLRKHPDLREKVEQYRTLTDMGVVKGMKKK